MLLLYWIECIGGRSANETAAMETSHVITWNAGTLTAAQLDVERRWADGCTGCTARYAPQLALQQHCNCTAGGQKWSSVDADGSPLIDCYADQLYITG